MKPLKSKTIVYRFYLLLILTVFAWYPVDRVYAEDEDIWWNNSVKATFNHWAKNISPPPDLRSIVYIKTIDNNNVQEILEIPLQEIFNNITNQYIYGLNLSGSVRLVTDTSFIRILLVDGANKEHLIYEAYPLIISTDMIGREFNITGVCEETCFTEEIEVFSSKIKIELLHASIAFENVTILANHVDNKPEPAAIKAGQNDVKIQAINSKDLKWTAGETSVSQLTYSEKKKLFGSGTGDKTINLKGFEYYKGGVFELLSEQSSSTGDESSSFIDSFDWRNRHGSDWLTDVKDQKSCGSCWAFAATGATEALVNLYFNQHLDLDLAEQDALSCSGAGSCAGGLPDSTLDYYSTTGVVDEDCFPYTASDNESCDNKCANPTEKIQINGKISPFTSDIPRTDDQLKSAIIQYGPLSSGISSLHHAMTLIGYDKDPDDSQTIWFFKNSFGTDWGEEGYANIKVAIGDFGWTWALKSPLVSNTPYKISCVDNDGDHYYNWGISGDRPADCASDDPGAKTEKDCDDASKNLGPYKLNGACEGLEVLPTTETVLVGDNDGIHPGDDADKPRQSDRVEKILSYLNNIKDLSGQNLSVDLDEEGDDRPVGLTHFFSLPDNAVIMSAKLSLNIKGTDTLVSNDSIIYNESISPTETDPECLQDSPSRPSCNPEPFFPLILVKDLHGSEPQSGEIYKLIIDFSSVPVRTGGDPGPGGSWSTNPDEYRNLLPLLYDGEFNMVVGDDAIVDFSELNITYVVPETKRKGDLDGNYDIDENDKEIFSAVLGKSDGQGGYTPLADYDGDKSITYADYRSWYGFYKNQ